MRQTQALPFQKVFASKLIELRGLRLSVRSADSHWFDRSVDWMDVDFPIFEFFLNFIFTKLWRRRCHFLILAEVALHFRSKCANLFADLLCRMHKRLLRHLRSKLITVLLGAGQ
jgi:hypothetical protein